VAVGVGLINSGARRMLASGLRGPGCGRSQSVFWPVGNTTYWRRLVRD